MIAIGTNTDPYQPIERERKIMRGILEVLEHAGHPVGIVTKSALVTCDIDILSRMAKRNLVKVALSVTTLDAKLARTMEPRASTPPKRLEALQLLSQAGIPSTVMVAPIIANRLLTRARPRPTLSMFFERWCIVRRRKEVAHPVVSSPLSSGYPVVWQ